MVTMEHDTSVSAEREKVSNFVRQRIAALTTARLKVARPSCSLEENGETCTNNGGSLQHESISDKDDNRKDILADEELQHAGCPICIACFAGMQSSEQVDEKDGGHHDCPYCNLCLKAAIKKIRRQSQRIIRGIDYDDLDCGSQGNSPGGSRRSSFVLRGEGKTFDALIDQLTSKRRKSEGRSRQSSIGSSGPGSIDRNVNDESKETKPNISNQSNDHFRAPGSNENVALAPLSRDNNPNIRETVPIPNKVLDAPVIPGTVKTECEKIEEIIITLPKKLGSVSHDFKDDEHDQRNGGNYDEILLGSEKEKVENTEITNTVDHKQAEKERISEAVRLGRISRGDSAIRFLARVSTLKSCNSVDDEVGADKSPINYGCSASYSPMSVSSDNANDASSIGNRSLGDFVYPDLQSRVRSLRLKSRSISPVSRSGGSPPSKLSTEDYHQMSQKKIGIIVDFNDFDDDDREDKEDEYGPESNEFATPKGQQKEILFAHSAREALAVNDHDIDDSEDDLQYRFGNVTRNVRNSSHFANRSSISMSRGLNSGDTHNLSLINPSNIQNDLKGREVADVARPTVRNDSYAFQANQWMRASLRLTDPLAGLVTTDTVNNQDLIDQGGDSIGVMPTSIRKADIGAAPASTSATRSAPLRPASMRVTSDRIPPAPLTRQKMIERSNSSNSMLHAGSVTADTVHDQDLIDKGGDRVGEMLSSIRKAGIGAASAPRSANRRPVSMRVTSDRIPPAHVTQPKKQTERSSLGHSMPRSTSALSSTSDMVDQDGDSVSDMLTSIRKAGISAVPRDTNRRPASMRVTSDRIPPAHVTQPKKSSLGNSMPRPTASHEAHNHDLVDQDGDCVSDMLTNIRKAGIGAASTSPPRDSRRPVSMRVTSDRIPPAHVTQPKKQTERSSLENSMPRPSTASHETHNYDLVDQDSDSVSDMLTNIRKAGIGAASVPRNDNRRPASMRVTSDRIPPAHVTRPKETERRTFNNSMPRPTDAGSFTSGDHDLIDQDGDSVSDMMTNIRRAGIGAASTSPPRTANRRPASMRVSSDMIPPAHGTRPRQTERSSLGSSMQRPTDSGSFTTDEIYSVRDECHPYTSGRRAERDRDGGSRSSSVRLSIGRKSSTESHNSSNPALLGRKAFVSVVRHNSSSNINMYDTTNKPRRVSNPVQPPKSKAKEEQANLFNEYLTREFSSSRRAEFQTEMELMSSIMKEKMVQLNDSILKVQMHSDESKQGGDLSKSGTVTTDKFNRKSILEVESDVMESHQMDNPMNLNMDLIRLRMRAASIHTDPNTPMRKSSLKLDADGNSVDFMSNPMIAKLRTASITTDPDTPIRRSSLQSNADSTTVDFMSNPMIARMRTASINTDPNTPLQKSSLQSGEDSTTVDYMSNPMIAKMRAASITTDPNAPLRKSSLQTGADSNAIEYMRHPISLRSKSIHTEPSTPLRKTSLRLDADSHAVEYVKNSTSMRSKSIHTDPNSPSVKSIFQIDAAKDGDAITNIRNQIKLAFTLNTSAWKPLSPPAVASNMVPRQRDRDGKNGGFIYTAHSDDDDKPDRKQDLFPQTLLTSPPQTDHMRHSINQYSSAHNDSELTQGRRNDGNLEGRNSTQVFLPIDRNQSDRQGQASIDSPSSSMRQSKAYDDRGGNSPDSSCYSYYNYNSENNHNSEDNNTVRDDVNRNVSESSQQHQVGSILLSDISLPEDSLMRGNHTATSQNCSPTASISTRLEVRGQGHAGSSSHTGKEIITVTSPTDTHTHRAASTSNQPTPDKLTAKDSNKYVSNMPKIDVALDVLTDVSSCERSDYQSPESNMNHALALASVWGSPRPEGDFSYYDYNSDDDDEDEQRPERNNVRTDRETADNDTLQSPQHTAAIKRISVTYDNMKKADSFGIKSPVSKNISRSASGNAGEKRGNLNNESQFSMTSLNAVPSGSTDMGSTEGLVPSFAPHNIRKIDLTTFEYPFDGKGVFSYISTQGDTKPYTNPHASGAVRVRMSSIATGSNAETVVEQVAAVLPNHTNVQRGSWVSIDLGCGRRLVPSRFCVLHGDVEDKNALRNFVIQGRSCDKEPWIELKKFRNNKKLQENCHSTASWGLKRKSSFMDNLLHCSRGDWGAVDQIGFRYFRLLQTGPNSSGTFGLFVGGLEFYGVLTENIQKSYFFDQNIADIIL